MGLVRAEVSGRVATVRLSNPPVNAMSRAMMTELADAFAGFGANRDVNVVVLCAEGDRAFCAGVDVKERAREREAPIDPSGRDPREVLDRGWSWRRALDAVRHCPLPVIAAVDGPAIGAGLCLVGAADVVFASPRARFGLTEIEVGLLGGSSYALRLFGRQKARRMFFTGELVPAAEAHRLGAVEELVAADQLESRAFAVAEAIAAKSPIGLRLAKESLNRTESLPLDEAYRLEQDYTQRMLIFDDAREAMSAYVERRTPEWNWR